MKRLTFITALATIILASGVTLSARGISAQQTPPLKQVPAQTKQAPAVKPPALSATLRDQWKFVSGEFISTADAMPEDRFDFAPTSGEFKGVRTFAEQVKHVACANFGFFREMEKLTPPADCEKGGASPAKTKAELMKYLGDSFAYGDTVMAKITSQNMLDRVEGPYAGPNTKIGIVIVAVWHATDHYGQMVEYLRMNGIVPPSSR